MYENSHSPTFVTYQNSFSLMFPIYIMHLKRLRLYIPIVKNYNVIYYLVLLYNKISIGTPYAKIKNCSQGSTSLQKRDGRPPLYCFLILQAIITLGVCHLSIFKICNMCTALMSLDLKAHLRNPFNIYLVLLKPVLVAQFCIIVTWILRKETLRFKSSLKYKEN